MIIITFFCICLSSKFKYHHMQNVNDSGTMHLFNSLEWNWSLFCRLFVLITLIDKCLVFDVRSISLPSNAHPHFIYFSIVAARTGIVFLCFTSLLIDAKVLIFFISINRRKFQMTRAVQISIICRVGPSVQLDKSICSRLFFSRSYRRRDVINKVSFRISFCLTKNSRRQASSIH